MKGKRAASAAKSSTAKATPALIREYDDDDIILKAMPSEKKTKVNVKFGDDVEMFEYRKHDYVPCSNGKPRKSMSRAQKQSIVCQTAQEVMNDPQWELQSKLGMTRARALGILVVDFGEFAEVDEVHIPQALIRSKKWIAGVLKKWIY